MNGGASLLVALGAALASGGAALLVRWESESRAAVGRVAPCAMAVTLGVAVFGLGLWLGLAAS